MKIELVLFASLVSFVVLGIMLISSGAYRQLVSHIPYQWKKTILLGAINPFIYYLMLFHAYELLPAQEAQAINYTWALMLAYLSVPLLGHHLSRRDILSGFICYMDNALIFSDNFLPKFISTSVTASIMPIFV